MAHFGSNPNEIIKNHVIWSMGLGLIPIPGVDVLGVSLVQLDMLKQLAKAYAVDYDETQGKAHISAIVATSVARIATSAVKVIPVVGTILGGGASAVFSGASTYALGEVFKDHFKNGGTFNNVNLDLFKEKYKETFEKGKEVAESLRKEKQQRQADRMYQERMQKSATEQAAETKKSTAIQSMDDKIDQLSKFAAMRDQGVLSEQEFERMKKKLFS